MRSGVRVDAPTGLYDRGRRPIPRVLGGHLSKGLAATREGSFKLTFAALVVAAAVVATVHPSRQNVSTVELAVVLALGMAVSGGLLLGAQLIAMRSKPAANAALAMVTLACVFTAYVVHTELFYPGNRLALVAICGAALFGLFVAFQVIDERRWGGVVLSAVALVAVSSPLWPDMAVGLGEPGGVLSLSEPRFWLALIGACGAGALTVFAFSRVVDESHWGVAALLAVLAVGVAVVMWTGLAVERRFSGDGWEKHEDVRAIEFDETPNVYFVGFDSIVPESIMQKYLGVDTTDFHLTFDREARRFRNLFANSVPSYYSINTLMALDQDVFLAGNGPGYFVRTPSYFAGHELSPLVWIMRENGYETTSIYENTYFGHTKGPHVDNYVINGELGGVCSLLDQDVRRWAFWGYCSIVNADRRQDADVAPGDSLVSELTDVVDGTPQFVIAHLYLPGHTSQRFRYDSEEDREIFVEQYRQASNRAAIFLGQIIEHVRSNDPTAMLFVFGDHGMHLSRGVEVEEDPAFYLQDRFAILGGVYPPDRCGEYFDEAESKGYMTMLDAVHAILGCLSGGQTALLEPRRDRFLEGLEEHDYHYQEFLYE